MCRTAEEQPAAEVKYELEESHVGENLAAGVHIVGMDIVAVHIDAGSHCVLVEAAETAAAGIVALAGLDETADTVVLVGLVELAGIAASVGLAVVADNDVLGIVGSADIVAQGTRVVVADTAA